MFLDINDHHQATNTKSQSEVKYNAVHSVGSVGATTVVTI